MKPLRQPDGADRWPGPKLPKPPWFCPALHGRNVHEVRSHGMRADVFMCLVCGEPVDLQWPRRELDQFGNFHYVNPGLALTKES